MYESREARADESGLLSRVAVSRRAAMTANALRLMELSQALRVAQIYLLCKEPTNPMLPVIGRTIARDCPTLTYQAPSSC